MNYKPLKKPRQLLSIVFMILSALFCLLIVFKVSGYYTSLARAQSGIEQAKAQGENDPNVVKEYFEERKNEADELVKKNLFVPPPPKRHPIRDVTGILGDTALINGDWHKVGDKIGEATVLEITSTYVKIEYEGKEKIYSPFDMEIKEEKKEEKKEEEKKEEKKEEEPKKAEAEVEEESSTSDEDIFAWMGVKLSAAAREKLLKQWNSMTEEQRQQAREQWNKMSDEEKQEAVRHLEGN